MRTKDAMITVKRIILIGWCLLAYVGPSHAQQHSVPLVELLADPAEALVKYPEGVGTIGYLHFDGGGGAYLFLTRDHALANDVASALFLSDDTDDRSIYDMKCDNEYVQVIGMIVIDGGQLSLGRIESIKRTDSLGSYCFVREVTE